MVISMKCKFIRLIITAMICILSVGYLLSHYDGKKYTIENVEDYVGSICKIGGVPGMSVVMLDNGQEYYINVGYADKNDKIEMTSEIRCELGSTTKAFTALDILILEQDGKLNRTDAVKDYLPWFRPTYDGNEANIMIEHLLCHTSGIPVWTIANLPEGTIQDVNLLENTVKGIQSVPLDNPPGTVHCYATINYDVLALIIEKISGMSYEAFTQKNVLEPLGMTDSYFRIDNAKSEQTAQGYRYAFMRAANYDAPAFYGNTAAGYLVSNTEDLSIWMKAQMGIFDEGITTEKVEHAINISHSYPVENGQHYFAGWNLYDTYFSHGGNNPNFSSNVFVGRTDKKAVFVLSNICGSASAKAADGIYRMMHGETVKPGLWVDGNSLLDFICTIVCLVEGCIMILLFEKKKYAGMIAFFCLLMAVIVLLLPYFFHYNYFALSVWVSPCLLIAIVGIEICLAEYIILYIYSRKNSEKKGHI